MAGDEIRFLGDLQRLSPQPGDVFVLTAEQRMTGDQIAHIREQWQSVMGATKVIVLDGGMRIGLVGEASCPSSD